MWCSWEKYLDLLNFSNFSGENCAVVLEVSLGDDDVVIGTVIAVISLAIIITIIFIFIRKTKTQLSKKAVEKFLVHPSRTLSDTIEGDQNDLFWWQFWKSLTLYHISFQIYIFRFWECGSVFCRRRYSSWFSNCSSSRR